MGEGEPKERENEEVGNPQTTPFFLAEERRSNRVTFFWESEPRRARRAPLARARLFNFRFWKFIAYNFPLRCNTHRVKF